MALSALRRVTTPQNEPIPRLDDDPEYARFSTLRLSLMAAQKARQDALDLLAIQHALTGAVSPGQRAALQERASRLAATAAHKPPEPISENGLPPEVGAALALMAGKAVTEPPDREAKIKRLRSEIKIVTDALNATENLLDAVRDDRSHEIAVRLQPQHRDILRTVYTSALAFSAAIAAERQLFADVLIAGYSGRPDILNRPALSSANRLGSAADYDAEISTFARRLAALKVI